LTDQKGLNAQNSNIIYANPKKGRNYSESTITTRFSDENYNRKRGKGGKNLSRNDKNPMMNPMMCMMMMNMMQKNNPLGNNDSSSSSDDSDDGLMDPSFSMMQNMQAQQPYWWNVQPPQFVDPSLGNQSLPGIKNPERTIDGKKKNRYKNGGDMMLPPLKNTCIFSPGSNYKENYESAKMFGRAEQNHEFEAKKAEFNEPNNEPAKREKKMPPLRIKKMHKPLLVIILLFFFVMKNRNGDAGLGRSRLLSVGKDMPRNC
jgi:hypothetical protein